jgi:hypothetical protein
MPITVTCPSCSVTFKTKDEYAGKRAKCPKCGEPLTIPVVDTVLMPPPAKAPVAARPVAASKPKPVVDDEADEGPKPKRRRDADDEDEKAVTKRKRGTDDDEPRAKTGKGDDENERPARKRATGDEDEKPRSRKRGDESDDDKPRSRRRRDDDDEPKKKSKTLPIILGIVGGLLLLCGGGCAGVYFGVIVPAAEKAKKELDAMASDMKNRAGGDGAGGNTGAPVVLTPDELADNFATYRGKVVTVRGVAEFVGGQGKKGSVILRGGAMKTQIVCNFEDTGNNSPPDVGEVVEVRGLVEAASNVAQVRLKECQLLNGKPFVTLKVVELLKDWKKHDGKVVVVSGEVGEVVDILNPPLINLVGSQDGDLTCSPGIKGWDKLPTVGETVTLWGRVRSVDRMDGSKGCTLEQCEIVPGKPAGR